MKAKLLSTQVAVLMLLAPAAAFVAAPAAAQQRQVAPVIAGLVVNADAGVAPGSTLRFQLNARPNARRADVVLGDSGITVPLRQQNAGIYTGSYVVRRSDRIDPTQVMAARVTHNGQTIARNFSYPAGFQQLAATAPPVAAVQAPKIERFVMRPRPGRLEAGTEVTFRLFGVPGATASVDIPGVVNGVNLAETRPGVYEGNYTIRRRDNLDAFSNAQATLRAGNQRMTAKVDVRGDRDGDGDRDGRGNREARDERAPQITDMTPANGERISERGRTQISARLSDEGTGIDPASVRLRLAGRDVTGDARVNDNVITYRGDLEPGRYTAEVQVRDLAGNTTTKNWTFDVLERDRDRDRDRQPVTSGPLMLQITSHPNNAVVGVNADVVLQGRTAPNATVRVQVESIASVGGALNVTQPVMDRTLQADRNGNFSVPVTGNGFVLPNSRWEARLTSTSGSQTTEERITLHRRG